MRFEHFDPSSESRSCVARTMTKLTGKEYSAVKAELTALAQSMGKDSYNDESVFGEYMAGFGMKKCGEYDDTRVGELDLGNGVYCVFCTDRKDFCHLMPVIDNVIYDRRDDYRELWVVAVYKKET
ncbi:MAG: hypothetical protein J5501_09225 [Ruminococcus sp.]|nr:hypothetical protein [Ruminococcus sp.]